MSRRFILPLILAGLSLAIMPAFVQAKGYLGVLIWMNSNGIQIREVLPGGPAAKGDLKPGDIIVKIDGTKPTLLTEFVEIIELKQPGLEVTLDIIRDGKEKKVKVTVGEK